MIKEKPMKLLRNTGFQGHITNKLTILFDRWEKVDFIKIDFQASLNWKGRYRLQETVVLIFTAIRWTMKLPNVLEFFKLKSI